MDLSLPRKGSAPHQPRTPPEINDNVLTKGTRLSIFFHMKPFDWNEEKNRWLKKERGVSFEQVVFSIESGKLLDVIRHPNPTKYEGQRVYVIEIEGYAYMVPYVEDKDVIFLKTIFPSRKYTRIYLKKDKE